jgi:hypothetical protein
MEIKGTAKKGAKPIVSFTLSSGAAVEHSPQHLEFVVISAWGKSAQVYRSYPTKKEAQERLKLVERLVKDYGGEFPKVYGAYAMELQNDLTYKCVAQWERPKN